MKAIDRLNCSVSYVVLKYSNVDHRFGIDPSGCKDGNSYEQKSNKALWNDLMIGMRWKSPFITMGLYKPVIKVIKDEYGKSWNDDC